MIWTCLRNEVRSNPLSVQFRCFANWHLTAVEPHSINWLKCRHSTSFIILLIVLFLGLPDIICSYFPRDFQILKNLRKMSSEILSLCGLWNKRSIYWKTHFTSVQKKERRVLSGLGSRSHSMYYHNGRQKVWPVILLSLTVNSKRLEDKKQSSFFQRHH